MEIYVVLKENSNGVKAIYASNNEALAVKKRNEAERKYAQDHQNMNQTKFAITKSDLQLSDQAMRSITEEYQNLRLRAAIVSQLEKAGLMPLSDDLIDELAINVSNQVQDGLDENLAISSHTDYVLFVFNKLKEKVKTSVSNDEILHMLDTVLLKTLSGAKVEEAIDFVIAEGEQIQEPKETQESSDLHQLIKEAFCNRFVKNNGDRLFPIGPLSDEAINVLTDQTYKQLEKGCININDLLQAEFDFVLCLYMDVRSSLRYIGEHQVYSETITSDLIMDILSQVIIKCSKGANKDDAIRETIKKAIKENKKDNIKEKLLKQLFSYNICFSNECIGKLHKEIVEAADREDAMKKRIDFIYSSYTLLKSKLCYLGLCSLKKEDPSECHGLLSALLEDMILKAKDYSAIEMIELTRLVIENNKNVSKLRREMIAQVILGKLNNAKLKVSYNIVKGILEKALKYSSYNDCVYLINHEIIILSSLKKTLSQYNKLANDNLLEVAYAIYCETGDEDLAVKNTLRYFL